MGKDEGKEMNINAPTDGDLFRRQEELFQIFKQDLK